MYNNQHKIRLSTAADVSVQELRRQTVVFDTSPELVENRNVNYKSFDPVHAPGQVYVYQSTSSRTFQLSSIKLISRTSQEASENLARLWVLRGWTLPNFGNPSLPVGSVDNDTDVNKLSVREMIGQMSESSNVTRYRGAPPPILKLSAYSGNGIGHIRNVPVLITQISIPYPTDVDYIPTAEANPTPMPTIMTIDIQLTEAHSPSEFEQFDLQQFRTGDLSGF